MTSRASSAELRAVVQACQQFVLDIEDEVIVEEFSCAGGMGKAIHMALGRHVDYAVNHDEDACSLYKANHPQTEVFCADVYGREVAPRLVVKGRRVGLFHMSPDCTDHSQAKGGQPRSKKLRALPWVAIKWVGQARPRVITFENVWAITRWGRLIAKRCKITGRVVKLDETVAAKGERVPVQEQYLIPDPRDEGRTWRRFLALLRAAGYEGAFWKVNAANHGAGTKRERLFGVFRCDGVPVVEPKPEYFANPARGQKRWKAAYESIDFSIEGKSIFGRPKPLVEASLRRVAYGLKKFVLDSGDPFIVPVTHSGGIRCNDIREPLRTITTAHRGEFMLAAPTLIQVSYGERQGQTPRALDIEQPLGTVVAGGIKHALVTAFVEQANGGHNSVLARDVEAPLSAITANGVHQRLVTAFVEQANGGKNTDPAKSVEQPLSTIMTRGANQRLVSTELASVEYDLSPEAEEGALRVAAFLIRYYGQGGQWSDLRDPMATITTKDRLALVTVHIRGTPHVVTDICMRMLTPRELANASSFPSDYKFEHGHDGRVFSKTKQVGFIGNAVPPLMGHGVLSAQPHIARPRELEAA